MSKSKVIAGDYVNYDVIAYRNKLFFMHHLKRIAVNKTNIANYEIINDIETHPFWKTLLKGAVGGAVFGAVGMFASVSSSSTVKRYMISIEFTDGKKSLINVDVDEYQCILKALF